MTLVKAMIAGSLLIVSNMVLATEYKPKECPNLGQVIQDYQSAIANSDEDKFRNLFFNYSIPWIGINPAKVTGTAPSNDGLEYGSVPGFAKWMVNSGKRFEEKMLEIKTNTNGNVANVFYHYEFFIDGKLFTRGAANWSLIKTAECWKITSKTYSKEAK